MERGFQLENAVPVAVKESNSDAKELKMAILAPNAVSRIARRMPRTQKPESLGRHTPNFRRCGLTLYPRGHIIETFWQPSRSPPILIVSRWLWGGTHDEIPLQCWRFVGGCRATPRTARPRLPTGKGLGKLPRSITHSMNHKFVLLAALVAGLLPASAVAQASPVLPVSPSETPAAKTPAAEAPKPPPPPTAFPAKIAIVEFQEAVIETNEGQQALAAVQKKYEPKQAELEAQNTEIVSLQKQLQNAPATMSDSERANRTRTLDTKQNSWTSTPGREDRVPDGPPGRLWHGRPEGSCNYGGLRSEERLHNPARREQSAGEPGNVDRGES